MLVDVTFTETRDPILAIVAGDRGNGIKRYAKGLYVIGHWSFDQEINEEILQPYRLHEFPGGLWEYGVCDSVEQFAEKFAPALDAEPTRKFVVSMVVLEKKNEPQEGGWRWHKWGPYIGEKNPQCEYLAHEGDEITQAVTYHIYELDPAPNGMGPGMSTLTEACEGQSELDYLENNRCNTEESE